MVDFCDLRVVYEVLNHLFCVFGMAFDAQTERFGALEQQKRGKRRDAGALVAEQDRADVGRECRRTGLGSEIHG